MDKNILIEHQKEQIIDKVESIRDYNIKLIEGTDNFTAIKREAEKLENRGIDIDVSFTLFDKIIEDAYREMKKCLRKDKSFTILPIIEEMGLSSFFDFLIEGDKLIEKEDKEEQVRERNIEIVKRRIERAVNKGDFAKEQEEKNRLEELENPEKFFDELLYIMDMLEKIGADNIESEYYDSYLEISKKLNTAKRKEERKLKREDNIEFTRGIRYDLREYILSLFFEKDTPISQSLDRFLKGFNGDLHLDLEHIYILYTYMKRNRKAKIKKVEGVLYFYVMYELYRSMTVIKDVTKFDSNVKVSFNTTADGFECETLEHYNRQYMLYLTEPKGYKCYYIEPNQLNIMSFLATREIKAINYDLFLSDFKEAQTIVKQRNKGVLFDFFKQEEENKLFPYILNETFPIEYMTGEYQDNLYKDFIIRYFREEELENLNMYNRLVKPIALDILGSIIRGKLSNLEQLKDRELAYIYYLSETKIGIAIREDVTEEMKEEIFGNYVDKLIKVKEPTLKELVQGAIF